MDEAIVPAFSAAAAREAAAHWGYDGDAQLELLCVSENATYLVRDGQGEAAAVLRLNRPGYHSHDEIASELAWTAALRTAHVARTPRWIPTLSGAPVARIGRSSDQLRHAVLFDFAPGEHPDDPEDGLDEIGAIAARLHAHARSWPRPEGFTRFSWDLPAALGGDGRRSRWGDWRDAVTGSERALLERSESLVRQALSAYGQSPDRYGLIHADLRWANLLVDKGSAAAVTVIDFDDCGHSWFLYDAAGSVSFLEHRPELPGLVAGWLDGYRRVASLEAADLAAIPALIMLRRLQLQAWAASHAETEMVRSLGPAFAAETALVAERYLSGQLLGGAT